MGKRSKAAAHHPVRFDRLIEDREHDAYRPAMKPPEPTVCPQCEVVFLDGRWAWAEAPPDARQSFCPACRRIHDQFPVGFVHVSGDYFMQHREELERLIESESEMEQSEHPLERIMEKAPADGGGMVVTTTGIHLARRLGEALHRACHGELNFHYSDAENLVRVYWHR